MPKMTTVPENESPDTNIPVAGTPSPIPDGFEEIPEIPQDPPVYSAVPYLKLPPQLLRRTFRHLRDHLKRLLSSLILLNLMQSLKNHLLESLFNGFHFCIIKNSAETNIEWDDVNEPISTAKITPTATDATLLTNTENPIVVEEVPLSNPTEEGSNLDVISFQGEDTEEENEESQNIDDNLTAYLSLGWKSNNFLAIIDLPPDKEHLAAARDFLLSCPLKIAFTISFSPNRELLSAFWVTAKVVVLKNSLGKDAECIQCRLPKNSKDSYCKEPSKDTIITWLDKLDIQWAVNEKTNEPIKNPSTIMKNMLNPVFGFIWAHFIQCLNGKVGSLDQAAIPTTVMVWAAINSKPLNYAKYVYDDMLTRKSIPAATPGYSHSTIGSKALQHDSTNIIVQLQDVLVTDGNVPLPVAPPTTASASTAAATDKSKKTSSKRRAPVIKPGLSLKRPAISSPPKAKKAKIWNPSKESHPSKDKSSGSGSLSNPPEVFEIEIQDIAAKKAAHQKITDAKAEAYQLEHDRQAQALKVT
ncbi:hypothetical protein OSB04_028686 [Centaurea solstitialis]|uniref:Uncharacterized protein n=1 Tax=Centaurea solstitialis TaxID=347529 RepID=A0AA38W7Z2_9ASTR|nr:hypothetical protein OSB04_028686 [Centaurea solstitialis]